MSTQQPSSDKSQNQTPARKSSRPPEPKPATHKLSGQHGISFSVCVKTLSGVTISKRGLLNLEMAVGLAVFLDAGIANKSSKGMLQEIYANAGYECADSSGRDYKTVNRRIQAASGLFGKLGLEVINHWADSKRENKLLQAIAHELTSLNFRSLDDVLDYIGRTSNRTAKAEAPEVEGAGPKIEAVKTPWNIEVGDPESPVIVALPPNLTEAQLLELASKIMALADLVHEAAVEGLEGGQEAFNQDRRTKTLAVAEDRRVH